MAAAKGTATLRGRFPAGQRVELVKVKGENVLRTSPSDKVVATKTVDENGEVSFPAEAGSRYFIRGVVNGVPREVRITGQKKGDESAVLSQPPVGNDEVKLGSGKTLAEHAEEKEDVPAIEVQPAAKQSHARDQLQRSSTPLGYATPVTPDEIQPHGRQEDEADGKNLQRSDTKTGQKTLIPDGSVPEKQEDADDGKLLQRSDTPHGVTTPIPAGDATQATFLRDAQVSKDLGGTEPNKAAARPPIATSAPRKRSSATTSAGKSAPRKAAKKAGGKAAKKTSARKRSR
jgi:hypothetical protein